MIGMINTVSAVPCNLAYVAIMFPSKRFAAFMCPLARLAFLSSAIHQVTMSVFSKLPFAIGQVQDVGLIFLSAMSTSVASLVPGGTGMDDPAIKNSDRVMVTTTLLAMALATCMTGVLLMLVGWCAPMHAAVQERERGGGSNIPALVATAVVHAYMTLRAIKYLHIFSSYASSCGLHVPRGRYCLFVRCRSDKPSLSRRRGELKGVVLQEEMGRHDCLHPSAGGCRLSGLCGVLLPGCRGGAIVREDRDHPANMGRHLPA